jgi:transcriptional regulator with XRE-family HTH domain
MEGIHPLKAFRERQDPPLSQDDLAGLLGVARETVTRWESGARKIDEKKLPVVAGKTGISPKELRPDLAELLGEAAQ